VSRKFWPSWYLVYMMPTYGQFLGHSRCNAVWTRKIETRFYPQSPLNIYRAFSCTSQTCYAGYTIRPGFKVNCKTHRTTMSVPVISSRVISSPAGESPIITGTENLTTGSSTLGVDRLHKNQLVWGLKRTVKRTSMAIEIASSRRWVRWAVSWSFLSPERDSRV